MGRDGDQARDLAVLDARLRNWGLWVSGGLPNALARPGEPERPVDELDAAKVERALLWLRQLSPRRYPAVVEYYRQGMWEESTSYERLAWWLRKHDPVSWRKERRTYHGASHSLLDMLCAQRWLEHGLRDMLDWL